MATKHLWRTSPNLPLIVWIIRGRLFVDRNYSRSKSPLFAAASTKALSDCLRVMLRLSIDLVFVCDVLEPIDRCSSSRTCNTAKAHARVVLGARMAVVT